MKEKIKPCPLCGSKKVRIHRTNEWACWVGCGRLTCELHGVSAPERKEAIRLWNRRPQTADLAKIISDDEKDYWEELPE